ncbi:hypothetical protein B7H20_27680 [Pseudomonas aeruginosa]|uniref:winged helix-turn-helix transcriptional regulator n=2 Tax=Pseudomonas TaxID=286 RepID=UPI0009B6517A|nr:hypothetical protein B7H20_27680 [Pseudomonas aeruginosa]
MPFISCSACWTANWRCRGVMCRRVADVLALVGGKWSILVVMTLRSGSLRFNELTRAVNGISQRMLTITLRVLERDGFVKRTVYPTPIRVEYELTSLGEGFSLSVGQLGRWVFNNLDLIFEARSSCTVRNP